MAESVPIHSAHAGAAGWFWGWYFSSLLTGC